MDWANWEEQVRLVAVSKLKPVTDILALHQESQMGGQGHVHFGENYAQELTEKAELLPKSIQWHFIGGLQSSTLSFLLCFLLCQVFGIHYELQSNTLSLSFSSVYETAAIPRFLQISQSPVKAFWFLVS